MLSSKSFLLSVTLLLLLSHSLPPTTADNELDELDELLSIDEQESDPSSTSQSKSSEADTLRKAQRAVLELSNENANKVIDENELVLVLGYTPWCPRSAELMPRFAEAAMNLRELGSGILMAKVDAERYGKAAGQLGIKGYPTMILFVNGTAVEYTGGFTG